MHILQACPVWIYTQSNITNISICVEPIFIIIIIFIEETFSYYMFFKTALTKPNYMGHIWTNYGIDLVQPMGHIWEVYGFGMAWLPS
jgi:hypothetical protein